MRTGGRHGSFCKGAAFLAAPSPELVARLESSTRERALQIFAARADDGSRFGLQSEAAFGRACRKPSECLPVAFAVTSRTSAHAFERE